MENEPSIQVSLCGGLGNQLFQILTMLEISITQNIPYYISDESTESPSIFNPRPTYWKTIFKKLKFTKKENIPKPLLEIKEVNSNEFLTIGKIICPCILQGYFQSSKYFSEKTFTEFISFEEKPTISLKTEIEIKNIFIHIRRGDYIHIQYFHIVLPIEWYKKALSHFSDKDNFYIFSDDIPWCEENFHFLNNKIFVKNEKDYTELQLMGQCDGGIISASSFSWFGAYLAELKTPDCKIVCPDPWYKDGISQQNFRIKKSWIVCSV